ncbi:MAG: ATP-binding protein [Pseudomonadota bacterium]
MLKQIKLSLFFGSIFFISFIVVDLLMEPELLTRLWIRIPAALVIFALYIYIRMRPARATPWIFHFALLGAATAVMAHLAIMNFAGASLAITYPSMMFIIAFAYGPLFVPVVPATLLSLSYIAAALLIYSAPSATVIDVSFQLALIVAVSLFSRYQLDIFSRRSFIDKRAADLARAVAEEKRQQAEQANREKAAFLRNASHNLRQPTQALSSYTLLLEKSLQGNDLKSANEAARNVTYAVDLLAEAFDKILDISRIDRDDYAPATSHFFINELLEAVQRQYTHQASQKGIHLKIVLRKKPPLVIRSDRLMMQQIVFNLVDNAIKYTKNGWVLVTVTRYGKGLRLHVIDSGIGMSTDQMQSVFQPFYRINEQCDVPGMGIGLSYVEKAIRKLPGHRLGCYSRPERGTHFYIDVAVQEESDLPRHPQESISAELEPGKFILLVDDNKLVLDALESQLVALGCIVEKAASVAQVRQIMRDTFREFDLVISDYKLAGDETAEAVVRCVRDLGRDLDRDIPVIVLTGERFSGETISLLGKEYPLLRKPVNTSQLSRSIAHALSTTGIVGI